jgi:acyl-CoA reductase-like NAD-dependent aldehyde dehydrogenase
VLDATHWEIIAMSSSPDLLNRTRVFVYRRIRDAFMRELIERTRKLRIDHLLGPETQAGSLISREHMQEGSIDRVMAEGARLAAGGVRWVAESYRILAARTVKRRSPLHGLKSVCVALGDSESLY